MVISAANAAYPQVGDVASEAGADYALAISIKNSGAGSIITPVFELAQAFEQNTDDVFVGYSENDAINNYEGF